MTTNLTFKNNSKMKKHQLIFAAAVLTALASCNKQPVEKAAVESTTLDVCITSGTSTKATTVSEGDEAAVSRIEVLVFNESGGLDAYQLYDGSNHKVTGITSTTGNKTVAAVVNAPDGSGVGSVTDLASLRALTSRFKADNDPDHFVMYGETAAILTASGTNQVSVEVQRLAARIRIDKITRALGNGGLATIPADKFEIIRFYLINVADDVNYGSSISAAANSYWITDDSTLPATAVNIDKDALVYSAAVTAGNANKLAQNANYENIHRLYAYPNASDTQKTKLVVEIKIDGQFYTFPIAIDSVESNKSYEIRKLTITRLGNWSDGDDVIDTNESTEPIVTTEFDCEIEVQPWNLVLLGDEGNITI